MVTEFQLHQIIVDLILFLIFLKPLKGTTAFPLKNIKNSTTINKNYLSLKKGTNIYKKPLTMVFL